MRQLEGNVALITGGGRGIGLAVAEALSAAGAAVALLGRSQTVLDRAAAALGAQSGQALPLACDITDVAQVRAAFQQTRAELGPVAILVNNAGVTASVKFVDTDDETWERIMRVNATAPFYCCREAVPDMVARGGGRIINIASIAAIHGLPYSSAYSASKHALLGLTRSLALELGRQGITANAICPGWVETDMLDDAVKNIMAKTGRDEAAARASILAMAGQQRFITPEEVAAEALRLAGPEGAGVSGEAIVLA
ncbi:MAG TPA: SDR family NAD(P)-dependent oxidoreductase [Roseiflexaceae bacterium]|nr:SDR family NAD(P)-dependent oxidoreductase [Roseiflexaceae bacterium]